MSSVKYKLTIAYDGGNYVGWQTQKSGPGVQQKIEEALGRLFPTPLVLHSSSRTDTGVHAIGMVAHVEIPAAELRMTDHKLSLAINAHLPPDIRIFKAQRCPADSHWASSRGQPGFWDRRTLPKGVPKRASGPR